MKIPSDAIISKSKLSNYLLKWRDEDDKSRFLARAGFTHDNPEDLEAAIRVLIETNEAIQDRTNQYGDYYRVEGELIGIKGHALGVVTIWIVQTAVDNKFRFVTLKPKRKLQDET